MIVDRQAILHVARLAQLELDELQIKHYESQLKKVLTYIAKLEELTDDEINKTEQRSTEPCHPQQQSCVGDLLNPETHEREDIVEQKDILEKVLEQAPQRVGTAFQVPKIIEKKQ